MDPLTLLRELYGEEAIRKIVASGFDSVGKISAATPESLSFFAGINEILARQILGSAEEMRDAPAETGYRGALAGSTEAPGKQQTMAPVKPRTAAAKSPPVRRSAEPRGRSRAVPLDDDPLLDAGGVLKTVASEPRPKEMMEEEVFLDEVGLTDAEANFLEGISPWPSEPRREKTSTAPPETPAPAPPFPMSGGGEMEVAPVSNWSPEMDPNPVPRLVRARELGPDPAGPAEEPPPSPPESLREPAPGDPPPRPTFWKFGR